MTVGILLSSTLQMLALFPATAVDDTKPFSTDNAHVATRSKTPSPHMKKETATQTSRNKAETAINPSDQTSNDYPFEQTLNLESEKDVDMDDRLIEQEMQRKQIYMERNNWQGRNIQDLHDATQDPVLKLSDEIATHKPLLIAVITSIQQLMSQTIAIHGTWGKNEKDIIYFVGDVRNMPHLPHGMNIVQLEGVDDKLATWEMKEMAVFKYLVAHYSESIDWFIITGDDVYVKVDALRKKLNNFKPSVNVYMGDKRKSGNDESCEPAPGVVYSTGLMSRVEPYLPQCLGEELTLGSCIVQRGIKCTRAKEVRSEYVYLYMEIACTGNLY